MAKKVPDDWFAAKIRAASGELGWCRYKLAENSGLHNDTITRALNRPPSDDPRQIETRRAIIKAFEAAGYKFPAKWRVRAWA